MIVICLYLIMCVMDCMVPSQVLFSLGRCGDDSGCDLSLSLPAGILGGDSRGHQSSCLFNMVLAYLE